MKILIIFLAIYCTSYAQIGIGTTTPTQPLDVNGNARVRGLSNTVNVTSPVSALPDGTLVTNLTSNSVLGTNFVGNLSADLPLNTETAKEIILGTEVIDAHDEYNTTTGRYVPKQNGYYKISMDFDIGGYDDVNNDLDILIGLWNFTTNKWAARRIFKHRDNNTDGIIDIRNESYIISNYLQLTAGNSYGFRLYATYSISAYKTASSRDAVLKFENAGTTGSSISTSFSIERVK